jgi:hypothetical protein
MQNKGDYQVNSVAWENGPEPAHTRPDTKGVLVEKSERE